MRCPFRINMEFEYAKIPTKKKDKDPSFLESAQKQEFGECYGDE